MFAPQAQIRLYSYSMIAEEDTITVDVPLEKVPADGTTSPLQVPSNDGETKSSPATTTTTTVEGNNVEFSPSAPSTSTTTASATPTTSSTTTPTPAKKGDDYGTYLNDPLSNPDIDASVLETLQWAKGYAGVGMVTKTFLLESPLSSSGEQLKIKLQHHTVTSKVTIYVGTEQVWEGTTKMHVANALAGVSTTTTPENRTFYFGKGTKAMFFFMNECKGLLPTPSAFRYSFYVDGTSPADEATQASKNDAGKDFKVWVPRADVDGDGITWYRVDTKRLGTGTEVAVHRRFRDFHFLQSQLGSYFKGSHLYNSLPRPPPKGIKILQNHMDPGFIEERRVKCEGYLRQLLLYPRVATIQEMHDFMGLPGGRLLERSVLFQPGSLGLKLNRQGMGASRVGVAAFNTVKGPVEDGGGDVAGPAEASGLINIGDSLCRVGGENVTQLPYDEVIRMVMDAPRPLVLHFTGYEVKHEQGNNGDDADGEVKGDGN